MKKHLLYLLAISVILVNGCQKEKSFEGGNNPSAGSLQADVSGDCLPKTVNGVYEAGTALDISTNTLSVDVNVTTAGAYTVYTDTVNGYSFKGTGTFTTTGTNTITLKGSGNPLASGINNFVVTYGTSECSIAVTVLPAGGASPAAFTLAGAPGNCSGAVINGTYLNGVALTSTNTVTISVNVTTIGTYSITTTFQGMTFAKAGAFITTGTQTVVLNGTGTPTTAGDNTVPITAGSTTCSFVVTVQATATGTLSGSPGGCTSSTINGSYIVGTALAAGNTVQVQITAASVGAYSITTNSVDGFSFAATGTAVLGTQLVTLVGTGTPTTSGIQTFTVSFGTSTCTFAVTVTNGAQAVYSLAGGPGACTPAVIAGIYMLNTVMVAANTLTITVDVSTVGAYSIATNTTDGFSFAGTGTFATTGVQTVVLTGTGTPTATGAQAFTVTGGPNTCTYTVNVVPIDYFPRTTNSNWSYELNDNVNPADTFIRKVIPQTLTAGANTYNIFMADDGSGGGFDSSGYYRRSGGDYFEYLDVGTFIGFDPPAIWSEYVMLKDDQPVGTVWNSPAFTGTVNLPPVTSFSVRFKYSIMQKDVPITITTSLGTATYQNVIVVQEQYEQLNPATMTWQDITSTVGSGRSYYARGIGLIKFEQYDPSNTIVNLLEMRRYQVF